MDTMTTISQAFIAASHLAAGELSPIWQTTVGILLVVLAVYLFARQTHIRLYVGFFGERALPWRGWIRQLFIYWLPSILLLAGSGLAFDGIAGLS
jgi:hypothetical protein